jgi:hypothetical protein
VIIRVCAYLASEPIPAAWFHNPLRLTGAEVANAIGEPPSGILKVSHAFELIARYGLARIEHNALHLHRLVAAIIRDQTQSRQAVYREVNAVLLVTAQPDTTDDPRTWPAWAALAPHVLAQDPATSPDDNLRLLATKIIRYLVWSGQARVALPVAKGLRSSWQSSLGSDHFTSLEISQQLAYVYQRLGDYETSRRLNEESLERCRRVRGPDHPATLKAATDLATDLYAVGELSKARRLNADTLQRSRHVLGEDARPTLGVAYNFAIDLDALGEVDAARKLAEDIYERRRRVLGEDHPDTLNSAGIQAGHLSESRQMNAARILAEDTLRRCRHALGSDHPQTLLSARSLAIYLRHLGEGEEASALEEETLQDYRRAFGDDHPETLAMAARLAARQNALDEESADDDIQDLRHIYREFRLL